MNMFKSVEKNKKRSSRWTLFCY